MSTYNELLAKKTALDAEIARLETSERKESLETVIRLVKQYGFTLQQVFPLPAAKKAVPAKFYDPNTGQSWSGRGRAPKWLDGKDHKLYEIKSEPQENEYVDTRTQPLFNDGNPFPIR